MRFLVLVSAAAANALLSAPLLPDVQPLLVTAGEAGNVRYARPQGSGYDGIASLFFERSDGPASCTGTLLGSGRHVLTAAHCLTNASGDFNTTLGDVTFQLPAGSDETIFVSRYSIHPDWTGDVRRGGDLAVLTLAIAAPFQIPRHLTYSATDELGQTAELVGFGSSGSGATGYLLEDGLRRGGRNRLDSTFVNTLDRSPGWTAGSTMLLIDFDDGSVAHNALGAFGLPDLGSGLDEVLPAPGDSGAPALLGGRIAGIASFATRLKNSDGTTADIDSVTNRSFGEVSALTRVSEYDEWISQQIALVPEPSSALPVCLALVIFLLRAADFLQNFFRSKAYSLARVRCSGLRHLLGIWML